MGILIQEALIWYNLPLTILLGAVLLYWIFVSIGVLSTESFDFDVDMNHDFDVDVNADVHVDMDHDFDVADADQDLDMDVSGGLGMAVLRFLNFGHVPAMIVISILISVLWIISIFGNFLLNGLGSVVVAGLIFFGALILAALFTKLFTMPLKTLFSSLKMEGETKQSIVGRQCVIRSVSADHEKGRAEVEGEGASFVIKVRVAEGREPLPKNTDALVVGFDEETDTFLIKKFTN